jgi:hypothetical protein
MKIPFRFNFAPAVIAAAINMFGVASSALAADPEFKPLFQTAAQAIAPARMVHSEGKGVFLENILALQTALRLQCDLAKIDRAASVLPIIEAA